MRKEWQVVYEVKSVEEAIMNGEYDTVEKALLGGFDPNVKMSNGGTVVITATGLNKLSIVKLLHQHGADLNARNDYGVSPLLSITSGCLGESEIKTIDWLLENEANPNYEDYRGDDFVKLIDRSDNNKDFINMLIKKHSDKFNRKNLKRLKGLRLKNVFL